LLLTKATDPSLRGANGIGCAAPLGFKQLGIPWTLIRLVQVNLVKDRLDPVADEPPPENGEKT
jgi:hypothetical protein